METSTAGSSIAGSFSVRRWPVALLAVVTIVGVACAPYDDPRRTSFQVSKDNVTAKYDPRSGKLRRVELDRDKNGTFETVSVWDGVRLLQIEVDGNGDGIVDRWEHYDGQPPVMTHVGSSSRNDGVEDMWLFNASGGGYVARIERDGDRNGQVDKWEEYDAPATPNGAPVLRRVGMDPSGTGKPTHWLAYKPDGSVQPVVPQ